MKTQTNNSKPWSGRLFSILITFILFPLTLFSQVPQSFNYQAVARSNGALLKNTTMDVRLSIMQGSATGTVAWNETQTVTTNGQGLFTIVAGSSSALNIDWSTGPYYLKVETDLKDGNGFTEMGTVQLLSVPYALYAKDVTNKDDADADSTNEIQDLQLNGHLLSLTLNGTPTVVDLSAYLDNTDSQTLALNGNELSISNGNMVTLNPDDADADPANEIQDLQLTGDTLTITNNNSATPIDLSPYNDNPWTVGGDTLSHVTGSVAVGTGSPMGTKLAVQGDNVLGTEPLFEVKRKDGQTVFAVYNDSIRMYVNATPTVKGPKGGFAIGGFSAAKGPVREYLRVTPDSVRVYVDQTPGVKGNRGGFAIGGFGAVKGGTTDLMHLTKDNYFIGHQSGENITTGLYNQFFGYQAGMKNTKGNYNIFMGFQSGFQSDSGDNNIFMGYQSGYNNRSGSFNVMIGTLVGLHNTTGKGNSIIGYHAGVWNTVGNLNSFMGTESGFFNSTGSQNSFYGYQTGANNTTGSYNVFVGLQSGYNNKSGSYNTFLGYQAGRRNQDAGYNVFIGFRSGYNNAGVAVTGDQGVYNTFIGFESGYGNTTGAHNSALGYRAGRLLTTGSYNVFMGDSAGASNGTGSYNAFYGTLAGKGNNSGNYNTFIGYQAGSSITSSNYNTAVGYRAGKNAAGGDFNVLLGSDAGYKNNGDYNVFIGYQSGYNNIGGTDARFSKWNTFIGYRAGYGNTTGWHNMCIGYLAGVSNQTATNQFIIGNEAGKDLIAGYGNTFLGHGAGRVSTNCSYNTILGYFAGSKNLTGSNNIYIGYAAGSKALGNNNVMIGDYSGQFNINGSGNVFIGHAAGYNETGSDKLYIDNSTISTPLIWGDFSTNDVTINGNLNVTGTITNISDIRLKKDVSIFENALDKIKLIKAVSYYWDFENHPEIVASVDPQLGVIAQDLLPVIPELVRKGARGYLSVDYTKLTVVLLEAIKEQQEIIESQGRKIEKLEKKNAEIIAITDRIRKLEAIAGAVAGK